MYLFIPFPDEMFIESADIVMIALAQCVYVVCGLIHIDLSPEAISGVSWVGPTQKITVLGRIILPPKIIHNNNDRNCHIARIHHVKTI